MEMWLMYLHVPYIGQNEVKYQKKSAAQIRFFFKIKMKFKYLVGIFLTFQYHRN